MVGRQRRASSLLGESASAAPSAALSRGRAERGEALAAAGVRRSERPQEGEVGHLAEVLRALHRPLPRRGDLFRAGLGEVDPPQLVGRAVPARPLEPVADHPHQRGLAGPPGALDADRQGRLRLDMLDAAGDRVCVACRPHGVASRPEVAADRRLLVADIEGAVGNAVGGHVRPEAGPQRSSGGDGEQRGVAVDRLAQILDADHGLAAVAPASSPAVLEADESLRACDGGVEHHAVQKDAVPAGDLRVGVHPAHRPSVDFGRLGHRLKPGQRGDDRAALEQREHDRLGPGERVALVEQSARLEHEGARFGAGALIELLILPRDPAGLSVERARVLLPELTVGDPHPTVGQPVRPREADHGSRLALVEPDPVRVPPPLTPLAARDAVRRVVEEGVREAFRCGGRRACHVVPPACGGSSTSGSPYRLGVTLARHTAVPLARSRGRGRRPRAAARSR